MHDGRIAHLEHMEMFGRIIALCLMGLTLGSCSVAVQAMYYAAYRDQHKPPSPEQIQAKMKLNALVNGIPLTRAPPATNGELSCRKAVASSLPGQSWQCDGGMAGHARWCEIYLQRSEALLRTADPLLARMTRSFTSGNCVDNANAPLVIARAYRICREGLHRYPLVIQQASKPKIRSG